MIIVTSPRTVTRQPPLQRERRHRRRLRILARRLKPIYSDNARDDDSDEEEGRSEVPMTRPSNRIRVQRLLVDGDGFSRRRIKQELNISDETYDRLRAELVGEGLVERIGKAGGGGLRLTAKGKLEASSAETSEVVSSSDSGFVKPRPGNEAVRRETWPATSYPVIETINRVLGAVAERFDGLSVTNTKNYFTAHLSGEGARTRTDWCFHPKGQFYRDEGLTVRKRRARRRAIGIRAPKQQTSWRRERNWDPTVS